jgi:hypothetical protein
MRISYLVLRLLFPSNSNQTLIYLPTSTQFSFLIPSYTWTHMSASSILLNTPVSTQSASHSISTLSLSHWWIRCHHLHPHASPPAHRSSLPTLSSRVCGEDLRQRAVVGRVADGPHGSYMVDLCGAPAPASIRHLSAVDLSQRPGVPGLEMFVDVREWWSLALGAHEGSHREPLQVRVNGVG